MGKKTVSHYDEHGMACEVELFEGEVVKYFPQEDRKYGFVKLENGSTLFFHLNNRSGMSPYEVDKLRFIPRFINQYSRPQQVLKTPEVGDRILFVIGMDRKGRVCADSWTYPSEYADALKSCETYRVLEVERIELNPNFKCLEIVHRTGQKATTPTIRFEGTKQAFENKFPFRGKLNVSDPLLSQRFGDSEYHRWFERETVTGWEPCGDPRTTKLQLSVDKAREILWACVRTTDMVSWKVSWHAQTRHLTFVVDETHPLVAVGEAWEDHRQIRFKESVDHLETTFVSTDPRFQSLWTAGQNLPTKVS